MAAVPYADLDRKLDLDAFGSSGISNPKNWPKPFTFSHANSVRLHDLGDEHVVLADIDAPMSEFK